MSPAASRVLLLAAPVVLLTGLGAAGTACVLRMPLPWLWPLVLALLVVSYAQLAVTAFGSVLGTVPRRPPVARQEATVPRPRTALLVPIYNERPEPVAAAIEIMAEALRPADNVSIFVLSDTQLPAGCNSSPAVWVRR